MDETEIDIMNKFGVTFVNSGISIMLPPRGTISKDDALVLAAWLVCLADPLGDRFAKVLEAVQST